MRAASLGTGGNPYYFTCCRLPYPSRFVCLFVYFATTCYSQRQDEREWASAAAGKIKGRGQEELWFCDNYISSKAKTRGCFGIPLELLKEQDRLLPMLTLNRK